MITEEEESTIRAFFTPDRAAAFLARATNRKTRDRAIQRLADVGSLELQYAHALTGDYSPEHVYQLLRQRGAPDACHVIGSTQFDGQDIDLLFALNEHLGTFCDVLISCLPGRLAYFHGHHPGDEFILER